MIQLRKPQGPFLSTSPDSTPTISPEGMLLYAIGDIHGRNDLLLQLVDMIRADVAQQCSPRRPTLVFLGDYIDRGPASHKVIDTLIALRSDPGFEMIALRGNHDQFLLDFLETGARGPLWMTFGGAPTLLAYGVTPPRRSDEPSWAEASKSLAAAMPPAHLSFLNSLPYCAVAGEYVFVHAGVRPKIELPSQRLSDVLSIREAFLEAATPLNGATVVFGHTPFEQPLMEAGKIGLDTGACVTGVLTALCLQAGRRRLIQTGTARGARDAPWPTLGKAARPRRL
jgi:serine/threonine protein phosphatase 1